MFTIKNWITQDVIKTIENNTLQYANLRNANLQYANLQYANLRNADLQYANLQYADLRNADLRNADLRNANLQYADLRNADLRNADLQYANLQYADLRNANLRNADLRNANLRNANLRNAYLPTPTIVLLANWGTCSSELCLDLMRYDASNHSHPEKFLMWANEECCPYTNEKIQRSANFTEKRELITEDFLDRKLFSAYELMVKLITEHCKNTGE